MKKQRTEEEMGRVLSAFDGSGQSVREFCAASGMAEHLLRYWLKRREKGSGGLPTEASPGFSELKISPKAGGFGLVLPQGLRLGIDGMAPQELARLLLELDRQRDA
jgi:transposase-like protein